MAEPFKLLKKSQPKHSYALPILYVLRLFVYMLGEVGATPKLLSLDIKRMGKEIPGLISDGVYLKPQQLSFKHTKQFPKIFFRLGAGAKNTKNGDFSALPRNCG